jgi:hypothetical protein
MRSESAAADPEPTDPRASPRAPRVKHQERGVLVAHVPVARPGAAAESSRQSVSAFVVDRLSEVAQAVRVADYVATYPAPRGGPVSRRRTLLARCGKCARRRELGGHRRFSPRRVLRRRGPPTRSRRRTTEGGRRAVRASAAGRGDRVRTTWHGPEQPRTPAGRSSSPHALTPGPDLCRQRPDWLQPRTAGPAGSAAWRVPPWSSPSWTGWPGRCRTLG